MKFIKLSLKYLKSNFFYIAILAIIPALILAITTEPASVFNFLKDFDGNNYENFLSVFEQVSELNWISALVCIALVPILTVFLSAQSGFTSRHMRLGIKNYNNYFRRVNNNFIPVLKVIITFLILLELYALLYTSFVFLYIKIFNAPIVALVISIITSIVLMLLLIFIFSIFVTVVPTMTIGGLNMRKAIAESALAVKGNIFKLFIAVLVPFFVAVVLFNSIAFIDHWTRRILNFPIYMFLIMYIITLMYASYCELMDVDREDLKNLSNKMTN